MTKFPVKWDLLATCLVALFGSAIAVQFLAQSRPIYFLQVYMPASVMFACDQGFLQPVHLSRELIDFLVGKSLAFDCAALAGTPATKAINHIAATHLYLAYSVAWLWRLLGVSYWSLWPLFAVLHGAYVAGCFVFCRFFLPLALALIIAMVLAAEPLAISHLALLRDYSKAPFIIWTLVALVFAIRTQSPGRLLVTSAIMGALLGIGVGFRVDVMILFPVAVLLLLFGVDRAICWRWRLASVATFVACSAAVGGPILALGVSGGLGVLMMEGLAEPFRAYLGLGRAPYDFGWAYSDELTVSAIAGDLYRADPVGYNLAEAEPRIGLTQANVRATGYVLQWLPLFSADVITHALRSAYLVAGLPSLEPLNYNFTPGVASYYIQTALAGNIALALNLVGRQWIPLVGSFGVLVFVWRVYARSPRQAAGITVTLLALLSYPSFQFASRHFFHLEFVFWLGLASLLMAPFEFVRLRASLRGFLGWTAGIAVVGLLVYLPALALQDARLKRETEGLINGAQEPVTTNMSRTGTSSLLVEVPVPPHMKAIVDGPADSLSLPAKRALKPPSSLKAGLDRLLLELGGPDCPMGPLTIRFLYERKPEVWQPLSRTIVLPSVQAGDPTKIIFPTLYRSTQHFTGLEITPAACLIALHRLTGNSRFPGILTMILEPDWKNRNFFQTFSGVPRCEEAASDSPPRCN